MVLLVCLCLLSFSTIRQISAVDIVEDPEVEGILLFFSLFIWNEFIIRYYGFISTKFLTEARFSHQLCPAICSFLVPAPKITCIVILTMHHWSHCLLTWHGALGDFCYGANHSKPTDRAEPCNFCTLRLCCSPCRLQLDCHKILLHASCWAPPHFPKTIFLLLKQTIPSTLYLAWTFSWKQHSIAQLSTMYSEYSQNLMKLLHWHQSKIWSLDPWLPNWNQPWACSRLHL